MYLCPRSATEWQTIPASYKTSVVLLIYPCQVKVYSTINDRTICVIGENPFKKLIFHSDQPVQ
jgi:hypothetical protein